MELRYLHHYKFRCDILKVKSLSLFQVVKIQTEKRKNIQYGPRTIRVTEKKKKNEQFRQF